MNKLYGYLIEEQGFNSPDAVYRYINTNMQSNEDLLVDLIIKTYQLTKLSNLVKKDSIFNFQASSSMAGGEFPCSAVECRMNSLEMLLRFASLYADQIIMQNPLDKHIENIEKGYINSHELYVDVCRLLEMRELVEDEIVTFESAYICLCGECRNQLEIKENRLINKMDEIYGLISNDFETSILCEAISFNGKPELLISKAEKFDLHETYIIPYDKQFEYINAILEKTGGHGRPLSKEEIHALGVTDKFLSPVYDDIFQNMINVFGSENSYLTNRSIDYTFLNELNQQNSKNFSLLNHSLSIVPEIKISNILELRRKDGSSFDNYRTIINKELRGRILNTKQECMDFNQDVIYPEIVKMNRSLEINKKHLIKGIHKDIIFYSGVLAVGTFSGEIATNVSQIMSAIGGIGTIKKIFDSSLDGNSKNGIQTNPYYFLWKLTNSK